MLGFLRRLSTTWPARILFLALAVAFVGWGVSGRLSFGGADGSSVATVEGTQVPAASFDRQFRENMQRLAQQFPDPSQIPPGIRAQVANETVQRLIAQQALDNTARTMGLAAPDKAVHDTITAYPAFQALNGKFDHDTYLQVLRQNNLTPAVFQQMTREDIARNQLLQAVSAGGAPSDTLTNLVYSYFNETRRADEVIIPFAGRTPPAPPSEATLQRYYGNNLARYTAPEYRRIRAVILSAASIGRTLTLSDADLRGWFEAHKAEFTAPELRSMQVITVGTAQAAQALAARWKAGADWAAMQAAAKAAGATATTLDQTARDGVPAPELAAAAFGAPLNTITGPVKEPLGLQLVRVTAITPAKNPGLAELRDTVRSRLGAEKAADLIDARAQKLQDLFAGGNRIDELPADIGAAGVQGTLDAQGKTPDGTPAPLPVQGEARSKLVADAFAAKKGETTQFSEGPDQTWYEVQVDDITPATPRSFATVRAKVLTDWQTAEIHHAAETEAARLLATVKSGQPLASAAWGTGRQVVRSAPIPRARPPADVPEQLAQVLFTLKLGEPTMLETPAGFIVATLADVTHPDPKADKDGVAEVRAGLARALRDMMVESYAGAVLMQAHATVNQKVVDQIAGAGQ